MGQVLASLVRLIAYIVPCLCVLLPVRFFTRLPSWVFRKFLHAVAFTCISLVVASAASWQVACVTCVVVAAAVYPLLAALESKPWFAGLFVQKSPGEIKRSLLMLFFMCAGLVAVAWGVFGKPELAVTAILMWGPGDAAAALTGIPFGKHKVSIGPEAGKKSWEGTAAMLACAATCGFALLLWNGYTPLRALALASSGGAAGAVTELLSPSEYDTITVPVAILALLLALARA